jgi:hypothetical protein
MKAAIPPTPQDVGFLAAIIVIVSVKISIRRTDLFGVRFLLPIFFALLLAQKAEFRFESGDFAQSGILSAKSIVRFSVSLGGL